MENVIVSDDITGKDVRFNRQFPIGDRSRNAQRLSDVFDAENQEFNLGRIVHAWNYIKTDPEKDIGTTVRPFCKIC